MGIGMGHATGDLKSVSGNAIGTHRGRSPVMLDTPHPLDPPGPPIANRQPGNFAFCPHGSFQVGRGAWRQRGHLFWCMLYFHQTISAFGRHISKTRRYTNVVCCQVLSSGIFSRRAAIQMSFVAK